MRVKLRTDFKLVKRNAIGQGGYHQDFIRVLVIVMLIDEVLYQAVDVAATAWDAATQNREYTEQARKFYKWANQPGKNISGTPDNVNPLTGKKQPRQSAKWFGYTWKKCLSDVLWNLARDVFNRVNVMTEEDRAAGLVGVTYWWDDRLNDIVQDVPEQPALTPQGEEDEPEAQPEKTRRNWYVPAAAAAVLLFLLWPLSTPDSSITQPYSTQTEASNQPVYTAKSWSGKTVEWERGHFHFVHTDFPAREAQDYADPPRQVAQKPIKRPSPKYLITPYKRLSSH